MDKEYKSTQAFSANPIKIKKGG